MVDLIWDFNKDDSSENYKFAVENYQDKLYLAILYVKREKQGLEFNILVYDRLNSQWLELYKQEINVEDTLDKYHVKILKIKSISSSGQDEVIFIFEYNDIFFSLRLDDDNNLEKININTFLIPKVTKSLSVGDTENLLWQSEVNNDNSEENNCLEIINIENLLSPSSSKITLPKNLINNDVKISHLNLYKDNFYLGIDNKQQGFTICKTEKEEKDEDSWQSILTKGAYRYSLNQKIFFMTVFQDDLYVASGLDLDVQNWEQNKLYPSGFEIIRIYDDNDWDIIVGTPKFSPQGLKVPLSGFDSGFNNPYNCLVESLITSQNQLYLVTRNIDSLEIWQSENGEDWQSNTLNYELDNYSKFKIKKTLSFSWGLIFITNLTDLYLKNNSQILGLNHF